MKKLFLLSLTFALTLVAADSAQAGNKKRAQNGENAVSYSKSYGHTSRSNSRTYSGGGIRYSAPRHSRPAYGNNVSSGRHTKRASRVRYY